MSRTIKSWVVAALTTLLVTMLPVFGSISSASAAAGDPIIPTTPTCTVTLVSGDPLTAPPAPTCFDPSGADQDEFLVPYYMDSTGRRVSYDDPDMNPYWYDRPNSTMGASQVSVQSTQYDPALGGYAPGAAWVLSFSTAVTAAPSANKYWVELGSCTSGGEPVRRATAFLVNESGVDGRFIRSVYVDANSGSGGGASDVDVVQRVYDGSTSTIPLLTNSFEQGLEPGETWTVKYWLADQGNAADPGNPSRWLGHQLSVYVPKCGDSTGSTPTVKPRASITKRCGAYRCSVKVVLGSRQATKATRYVVVRDPRRGPTVRRVYTVRHKVVRYYKVRKGTVVKVRFGNTVIRKRI